MVERRGMKGGEREGDRVIVRWVEREKELKAVGGGGVEWRRIQVITPSFT